MKYDKSVYRALLDSGMSRREIARHLGVNESSVRRSLKGYDRRIDSIISGQQKYEITVRPL